MKQPYVISFSGGRTSGLMTKWLIDEYSFVFDFTVVFANTGKEDDRTLEFVNNCDKYFGFSTVWVEAVVHHGIRKSCTHKIVTFETACRNGDVFEECVKKYGVPNVAFPQCTRELKLNPMKSYLKSIGIDYKKTPTALGIREDEMRRVKKSEFRNITYPLVDMWPTTKDMVLAWWSEQNFDLGIEEFEGNCVGCFKKSQKKLFMQAKKNRAVFEWHREIEKKYRAVGPQDGDRVFFRGNLDTNGLLATYDYLQETAKAAGEGVDLFDFIPPTDKNENSGCGESCELFEMEDKNG